LNVCAGLPTLTMKVDQLPSLPSHDCDGEKTNGEGDAVVSVMASGMRACGAVVVGRRVKANPRDGRHGCHPQRLILRGMPSHDVVPRLRTRDMQGTWPPGFQRSLRLGGRRITKYPCLPNFPHQFLQIVSANPQIVSGSLQLTTQAWLP
jgi:hypothetical protein